jgi:triacylglycerol lipase
MIWSCVGCDQQTKPIRSHEIKEDVQNVRAILSVYEEYTVLAFRYTATLKNVWQDLLWAIQVQDQNAPDGCKVQKQHDNMWNSIKNQTFADLIASSHTKHLIITGISLGGGLASLSYVDINVLKIFDKIEIITYGAPRVGNANWAKWLGTQI